MPNFHEITNETNPQSVISKYINAYSEMTGRNVIVYYSGWLNHTHPRSGSSINDLDKNGFMSVIHGLDKSKGLDLFLHTPGVMLEPLNLLLIICMIHLEEILEQLFHK